MASKFWVGGGTNNTWASTPVTNWANSSGGTGNQTAPSTGDVAVFDGGSGSGNSVIGASTAVQSLECDGSTLGTGAYAGTLTHNSGVTLTLNTGQANTLRFSAGMTYAPAALTSVITLTHTSGTANVKLYGQKLWAFTVNGAGGTTQTLDAFLCNAGQNATTTLTTGILDFNGGAGGPFTFTTGIFNGSNANTRSLILGSTVTLSGNLTVNQNVWNFSNTTGLTFTKNSANIIVLSPTSSIQGMTFLGGGQTYNDLTLNATSNNTMFVINNANTFAHFNVGMGWSVSFPAAATTTINNAFAWSGSAANPMLLISTNPAANVGTISVPSGACTLQWGGLFGITVTGGATFTATNAFNFGTNSGWVITPPSDYTMTLNANAITQLDNTTGATCAGTVTTGASTTSVPTSALSIAGSAAAGVVANQFVGRVVLLNGNTTTAGLRGAVAAITASSASNTPTLTVSPALPATPASGDTFSIV